MARPQDDTKICTSCGRSFGWRKKWAEDWESVRYCSDSCRRRKVGRKDSALEHAILHLLKSRPRNGSICPSEAARALGDEGWRDRMEPARRAARRLAGRGMIEITQSGRAVDPTSFRGAIRLRFTTQSKTQTGSKA